MRHNNKSVAKSSLQVVFLTILIKVVAFLKQTVLATTFGTTVAIDLYLLSADTLGDFSVAIFSALSISVMTLYLKYYENDKKTDSDKVIGTAFKFFIPFSIIFSLLFCLFSKEIASLIAFNYDYGEQIVVSNYIKIISPTILFLCITYISVAVLDANKVFWPGKMINFTLSIIIIFTTLIYGNTHSTKVLAYAYSFAYFVHLLLIVYISKKYYSKEKVCFKNNKYIRAMLIMFFPLFLGNAAIEISTLIDKLIATSIGKGLLSAQTFGSTLNSFVVSIFIVSPINVLLSYISSYAAKNEQEKIIKLVEKSILIFVAILIPISIITFFNATSIVSVVYERGAFDETSVKNTTLCLLGYAVGFIFMAIRDILIKVHLAYRDSKTVMINGIISIVVNIIISIILSKYFGLIGISLGTTISTVVCMILCIITSEKHLGKNMSRDFKKELFKMIISSCVLVLVSMLLINVNITGSTFINLIIISLITFLVHFMVLILVKSSTIDYLIQFIKHKNILKRT